MEETKSTVTTETTEPKEKTLDFSKDKTRTFTERIAEFIKEVPKEKRFSEFAGWLMKSIILDNQPCSKSNEFAHKNFYEKPGHVKYMHVYKDPAEYGTDKFCVIIEIRDDDTWEVFYALLEWIESINSYGYSYIRSAGQPTSLSEAFLDYRDNYIHGIREKERKEKYKREHPTEDPEPCLKAYTHVEVPKKGLFTRILDWFFPPYYQ